jgi:DNA mismatch repair protein MSH2
VSFVLFAFCLSLSLSLSFDICLSPCLCFAMMTLQACQNKGLMFTTEGSRGLVALSEKRRETWEEYNAEQQGLLRQALEVARTFVPVCESASRLVSEMDVLRSFAYAANGNLGAELYSCPTILPREAGVINMKECRHPCLELLEDVAFIKNSYQLKRGESHFQIITGPNMGGKSTYIRQIGCIVFLAQIGSFVPCGDDCEISIVDSILARVGAGDAQMKGVSTFMAEMLEASVILDSVTENSLVIVDELGRGTSTYDGFGLAWAISEHMATQVKCYAMFATHFHELTELEHQVSGVVNKHVSAKIDDTSITMLYDVRNGPCKRSFGIHVAELAGFPQEVLQVAKRKLDELEGGAHSSTSTGTESPEREKAPHAQKMLASHSPPKKQRAEDLRKFMSIFQQLPIDIMTEEEAKAAVKQLIAKEKTQQTELWKSLEAAGADVLIGA